MHKKRDSPVQRQFHSSPVCTLNHLNPRNGDEKLVSSYGGELTILRRALLTLQTIKESPEPFQCILSQLLSPQRQTQVLSHLPNVGWIVTKDQSFPLFLQQWQGMSFSSHLLL